MKKSFILFYFFISSSLLAQSLINVYPFPSYNPYNFFWGITHVGNDLWIATDFDGTGYPFSKMYRVSKTGAILDSVTSSFKFNHGLAWDGADFYGLKIIELLVLEFSVLLLPELKLTALRCQA